ncbi:MAG: acyl-ACP--UDP-N-acetylglucosamine O-acyltransferase [Candidatus Hydrogenedentes bacterium]|nr:acyl-ACP--UDP-N-acetylglucosamine O-acyltransferase [Kiritimatiellia bacterium]NLT62299.1 acyl-ACP--UDP-N-acetylglucosamine O-acyltransferase [Candidatus Hydrogenedentota bacterium]HNZ16772.1 acyl-ACP--UDP-N-acetylglucosamine O-acyltransferase [Candidatus Hydrogenedentota bacterium]HOH34635.1 acyl-ACP--UDP-N-acetylglucosamine O-acyltransferase [Candidatus Hydrogenedentota bacterium]HPV39177.1 acyl-ACP--UDP-N-acetylglucosamine O-acyltransferase [Candidatus Hydrogenedentota bacterium]
MTIHPTAIIDPKAELADDVEVQPYTIIGPTVTIGSGTVVGPHCVITGRTVIGKNNRIFSGCQIGVLSQDLKHKEGLVGRTSIGDNNMLREHVTISASTMTSYDDDHRTTSIGDSCLMMAYSHVAHDCHVGDFVVMANCASLSGHVDVEDRATLGGLSGVHQECVVGTMAFVGGMTRVVKDVAPYMIVEGNPGQCHGPNSVGLRRAGFDTEARRRIKQMYKIMFRSDLNTTQALHEIEASIEESDERNHFVDFVRKSIRGITK